MRENDYMVDDKDENSKKRESEIPLNYNKRMNNQQTISIDQSIK